jgi:hypothetical protein
VREDPDEFAEAVESAVTPGLSGTPEVGPLRWRRPGVLGEFLDEADIVHHPDQSRENPG